MQVQECNNVVLARVCLVVLNEEKFLLIFKVHKDLNDEMGKMVILAVLLGWPSTKPVCISCNFVSSFWW